MIRALERKRPPLRVSTTKTRNLLYTPWTQCRKSEEDTSLAIDKIFQRHSFMICVHHWTTCDANLRRYEFRSQKRIQKTPLLRSTSATNFMYFKNGYDEGSNRGALRDKLCIQCTTRCTVRSLYQYCSYTHAYNGSVNEDILLCSTCYILVVGNAAYQVLPNSMYEQSTYIYIRSRTRSKMIVVDCPGIFNPRVSDNSWFGSVQLLHNANPLVVLHAHLLHCLLCRSGLEHKQNHFARNHKQKQKQKLKRWDTNK